jgi:hypothetical protein
MKENKKVKFNLVIKCDAGLTDIKGIQSCLNEDLKNKYCFHEISCGIDEKVHQDTIVFNMQIDKEKTKESIKDFIEELINDVENFFKKYNLDLDGVFNKDIVINDLVNGTSCENFSLTLEFLHKDIKKQ